MLLRRALKVISLLFCNKQLAVLKLLSHSNAIPAIWCLGRCNLLLVSPRIRLILGCNPCFDVAHDSSRWQSVRLGMIQYTLLNWPAFEEQIRDVLAAQRAQQIGYGQPEIPVCLPLSQSAAVS